MLGEVLKPYLYTQKLYPDLKVIIFFLTWLQVDKVVQMYETMMTRHTTMVVGPTGGGKSVVINTLCQAQTRSLLPKCQHRHFSIN